MMTQSEIETWRPIEGFSRYEVSDHGRVRSWAVQGSPSKRSAVPKIMKVDRKIHRYGYPSVIISTDDCQRATFVIHALVLRAFVGPPVRPKYRGSAS